MELSQISREASRETRKHVKTIYIYISAMFKEEELEKKSEKKKKKCGRNRREGSRNGIGPKT